MTPSEDCDRRLLGIVSCKESFDLDELDETEMADPKDDVIPPSDG